jgi:hypothetical protein
MLDALTTTDTLCADLARALARLIAVPDVPLPADRDVRCWARIAANHTSDAWLISWPTGGSVALHDHGGSAGAIAVVAGELVEITPGRRELTRRVLSVGQVHDVAPDAVHDVLNVGPMPALSVHVYSPPLAQMTFYDPTDLRPLRVIEMPATENNPSSNGAHDRLVWTTAH